MGKLKRGNINKKSIPELGCLIFPELNSNTKTTDEVFLPHRLKFMDYPIIKLQNALKNSINILVTLKKLGCFVASFIASSTEVPSLVTG